MIRSFYSASPGSAACARSAGAVRRTVGITRRASVGMTSRLQIGVPLAPLTLALVLGNRSEDAFRLSMIGAGGDLGVFWSNGLVGS
ncbi:MAG: hypothetical protein WA756_21290, partial [Pseudolabrys sp.]